MTLPDSITCPVCGHISYHPTDIKEGYCGHCHDYTRDTHLPKYGTVDNKKCLVVAYRGRGIFVLQDEEGRSQHSFHRKVIKFSND